MVVISNAAINIFFHIHKRIRLFNGLSVINNLDIQKALVVEIINDPNLE